MRRGRGRIWEGGGGEYGKGEGENRGRGRGRIGEGRWVLDVYWSPSNCAKDCVC
jgi:hypothetical protein